MRAEGLVIAAVGAGILILTLAVDLTTYGLTVPALAGLQILAIGMMGGGTAEATGGKVKIGK